VASRPPPGAAGAAWNLTMPFAVTANASLEARCVEDLPETRANPGFCRQLSRPTREMSKSVDWVVRDAVRTELVSG